MQIEIEKVNIDFACMKCTAVKAQVPITEILETGSPICVDCHEVMEGICAHLEQMEEMEGRLG